MSQTVTPTARSTVNEVFWAQLVADTLLTKLLAFLDKYTGLKIGSEQNIWNGALPTPKSFRRGVESVFCLSGYRRSQNYCKKVLQK